MNPGILTSGYAPPAMPASLLGSPRSVPMPLRYGPFAPADIPGLLAWFDATDAATLSIDTGVTEWRCKAIQGQKFSQGVGAEQPTLDRAGINGLPALAFSGTQWMDLGSQSLGGNSLFASASNPISYFFVCRSNLQTALVRTLFGKGNGWTQIGQITSSVYAVINGGAVSLAGMTAGTNGLLRLVCVGVGSEVYFNNAKTSFSLGAVAAPSANVTLGVRELPTKQQYWNGRCGEVIVYSRVLAPNETRSVLDYLNSKWSLSIT